MKQVFIIILSLMVSLTMMLKGMNNMFWTQDRPLVGLPPLPTQLYQPPSNPIRCCKSNPHNCCTYLPCTPTILDYNYNCNCFDDCNPINPVWTEVKSSKSSRRDILNNIRSCAR